MPDSNKRESKKEPKYKLMDRVLHERDISRGLFNVTGFDTMKIARPSGSGGRITQAHVVMPRMEIGGTLKKSIAAEEPQENNGVFSIVVRANAPYAWYVETGEGRGPQQAFMLPALEEVKGEIVKMLLANKGKG